MATHRILLALVLAAPSFWLSGCATSPAAMAQANHTVQLMSLMEEPLGRYRDTWSALERSRLGTLKAQRQMLAKSDLAEQRDRLASVAAGGVKQEALRVKLLANVEAMQTAQGKSVEDVLAYDARIDALLQPLPSTTASVTGAQAAAAQMGAELSKETRAKELRDFALEVSKGLKDSRKAQGDNQAAAEKTAAELVETAKATQ